MNFALFATLLILGNYIIEQNKLITKKRRLTHEKG